MNEMASARSGRSRRDMTVKELKHLMTIAIRGRMVEGTNVAVAELIGVHRLTVGRWLAGAPINAAMAALIRDRLSQPTKSP